MLANNKTDAAVNIMDNGNDVLADMKVKYYHGIIMCLYQVNVGLTHLSLYKYHNSMNLEPYYIINVPKMIEL